MMKICAYEVEVLTQMLDGHLNNTQIDSVLKSPVTGYEYTGAGYFLELTNKALPKVSKTISDPNIIGRADDFIVGFLVYIENQKLTLECHSWGTKNPPSTIREKSLTLSHS